MTAQTQKAVTFYGDTLIAIRQDDSGAIFVPLARLCDSLGIARARQAQRIREHPVISRGFETLNIETPGGAQAAQCLRLDMIPLTVELLLPAGSAPILAQQGRATAAAAHGNQAASNHTCSSTAYTMHQFARSHYRDI